MNAELRSTCCKRFRPGEWDDDQAPVEVELVGIQFEELVIRISCALNEDVDDGRPATVRLTANECDREAGVASLERNPAGPRDTRVPGIRLGDVLRVDELKTDVGIRALPGLGASRAVRRLVQLCVYV